VNSVLNNRRKETLGEAFWGAYQKKKKREREGRNKPKRTRRKKRAGDDGEDLHLHLTTSQPTKKLSRRRDKGKKKSAGYAKNQASHFVPAHFLAENFFRYDEQAKVTRSLLIFFRCYIIEIVSFALVDCSCWFEIRVAIDRSRDSFALLLELFDTL
jgi:hypothetical protein